VRRWPEAWTAAASSEPRRIYRWIEDTLQRRSPNPGACGRRSAPVNRPPLRDGSHGIRGRAGLPRSDGLEPARARGPGQKLFLGRTEPIGRDLSHVLVEADASGNVCRTID